MITNSAPLKNSAISLLSLVKGKLDTKDKWTKGAMARDENGTRLNPTTDSDKAICWCITGAMEACKFTHSVYEKAYVILMEAIDDAISEISSVEEYNDLASTSYQDIMNLIDAAIVKLQREPSDA